MQALGAVDLDVGDRVEEVEAGHPGCDGSAEQPGRERQLARHRHPAADGREAPALRRAAWLSHVTRLRYG